jgi:hypothetical protein
MSKKGHYSGGHSVIRGGRFVASHDPAEKPRKKRTKAKKEAMAYFSRLSRARSNETLLDAKYRNRESS